MSVFSTKNIRSMLRAMLTGYRQFSLQSAGAYQNSKNFPGSSFMGKCAEFSNHTNCLGGAFTFANHSDATWELTLTS